MGSFAPCPFLKICQCNKAIGAQINNIPNDIPVIAVGVIKNRRGVLHRTGFFLILCKSPYNLAVFSLDQTCNGFPVWNARADEQHFH